MLVVWFGGLTNLIEVPKLAEGVVRIGVCHPERNNVKSKDLRRCYLRILLVKYKTFTFCR